MATVGILAFGSLITDRGDEIDSLIEECRDAVTPFNVEFGRYSRKKRGGAPTLVPVTKSGRPVKAKVFVLKEGVSHRCATDVLWRRETGTKDKKKRYPALRTPRAVRVKPLRDFAGVDMVLYTDFYASGKLRNPTPRNLARRAIQSVRTAPLEQDGISYLIAAKHAGVRTPLTHAYETEVLRQTQTDSLEDALQQAKASPNQGMQPTK